VKKEIEGVLLREKDQLVIKTDDGKTKLVFNLFDGLAAKRVKITVEEVEQKQEKEEQGHEEKI